VNGRFGKTRILASRTATAREHNACRVRGSSVEDQVGRTPWSAADALVGLVGEIDEAEERVQGVPSSSPLVGCGPMITPLRSRFGNALPSRDREGVGAVAKGVWSTRL
jgi:hypothetical protein